MEKNNNYLTGLSFETFRNLFYGFHTVLLTWSTLVKQTFSMQICGKISPTKLNVSPTVSILCYGNVLYGSLGGFSMKNVYDIFDK